MSEMQLIEHGEVNGRFLPVHEHTRASLEGWLHVERGILAHADTESTFNQPRSFSAREIRNARKRLAVIEAELARRAHQ